VPIDGCFDFSRDIDFVHAVQAHTREIAVAGVTKGLIEPNEEVAWEQRISEFARDSMTKITAYHRPFHFRDSHVRGAFRRFDHDHFSASRLRNPLMRDVFDYESPVGILGGVAITRISRGT